MAQKFASNYALEPGNPGDTGVVQVVSLTGSVSLQGTVDGTNWTEIKNYTTAAIDAVVLAPQMRVVQTGGSDAVVWLEG